MVTNCPSPKPWSLPHLRLGSRPNLPDENRWEGKGKFGAGRPTQTPWTSPLLRVGIETVLLLLSWSHSWFLGWDILSPWQQGKGKENHSYPSFSRRLEHHSSSSLGKVGRPGEVAGFWVRDWGEKCLQTTPNVHIYLTHSKLKRIRSQSE